MSDATARARSLLEQVILPAVHDPCQPLTVEIAHVHGEPIAHAEAVLQAFAPAEVGVAWGAPWDTAWFRLRGQIPSAWQGERVVARIDLGYHDLPGFGGEGLVWVDGEPVRGLSSRHHDVLLTASAEGAEPVELLVEAAANPMTPPGPDPRPRHDPEPGGRPLYRLERADLAVVRAGVEALAHDLRIVVGLAIELDEASDAGTVARAALDALLDVLDPDDVAGSAVAARAALAPALTRPATSPHAITAIGHAHIDSAWLWPVRETIRKVARTTSTALDLMGRYPEYRFAFSQPQQWDWIRRRYPSLFARLRERVAEGRVEPVGAMWVEPDCNLPLGESLVRQLVHGKRFFREHLGVDVNGVWLPDAFGYTPALPQLARLAGCDWFLTQKLSWNDTNVFPHRTFWWEGIDGSRLLTHFPPCDTYNGDVSVAELRKGEAAAPDPRSLYLFGWGDGGGGPTAEMLESARRLADVDGVAPVTVGSARQFFAEIAADADDLPVWVGELYLELHRGTYTTQARTKRGNRRGELALRQAELWSALRDDAATAYPAEMLAQAWQRLLLNQFHDILPGSSIARVHEEAERDHAEIVAAAEAITDDALAAIAGPPHGATLVVFNALSHARREPVEVPEGLDGDVARGPDGDVGIQADGDGRRRFLAEVPACGYAVYGIASGAPAATPLRADQRGLENDVLRVAWDERGRLTSVWDKEAVREVLAGPGNRLQVFRDQPAQWDAWDIDAGYVDDGMDVDDLRGIEVVERGPARAAVRLTWCVGDSTIVQDVRLAAGSRRLEFVTRVDWQERHRLLRVAFPVAVRAPHATFEIAFGVMERPTHRNTSWEQARFEVPAHRFADLSEAGYGVALLNDCKYGHAVEGNVLSLSLLRGPTWPDPDADRGEHAFTYALHPHLGDCHQGRVRQEAHALNVPLRAVAGGSRLARTQRALIEVDDPDVVIETVKRADDGDGVVVRLYEAAGGHRRARLRTDIAHTAVSRVDLLEEAIADGELDTADGVITVALRPFEVTTLRLR